MQKIILFLLIIGAFSILKGQSFGPRKWQIVYINNHPIKVYQVDIDIMGNKLVPYLNEFEKNLTKKYGKQFDNCYRDIRFGGIGMKTIMAHLIPDHLDSKENWLKMKYDSKGEKVYQINYMIKTKTFSKIVHLPPLPR